MRRPVLLRGVDRTGRKAAVRIAPGDIGRGIVFNGIVASPWTACAVRYCTMVGEIGAVEHLLAACHVAAVTDLTVDCDGSELPLGDGSALPYVRLLRKAGITRTLEGIRPLRVRQTFTQRQNGRLFVLGPAERLLLTCLARVGRLGVRCISVSLRGTNGVRGLTSARTFGYLDTPPGVLRRRLCVRFQLKRVLGLVMPARRRCMDEPWRHKMLDLLGDLWLLGRPLLCRLVAVEPGHRFNLALVRLLAQLEE